MHDLNVIIQKNAGGESIDKLSPKISPRHFHQKRRLKTQEFPLLLNNDASDQKTLKYKIFFY